jgi:hypothetical protein
VSVVKKRRRGVWKSCLYDVLATFAVTAEMGSVASRSESEGEGAIVSGVRACVVVLCRYPGKRLGVTACPYST